MHISERNYWVILLVFLISFFIVNLLFILPIIRDLGINLATDILFTTFTIVFLTWAIRSRENGQWRRVEKEISKRASRRLGKILEMLGAYFLSEFEEPGILEKVKEKVHADPHPPKYPQFMLEGSECAGLLLEYYSDETHIHLGSAWKESCEKPGNIEKLHAETTANINYLESLISSYFRFLDPRLMHSVMAIESCLEHLNLYLDLFEDHMKNMWHVRRLQDPPKRRPVCNLDWDYAEQYREYLTKAIRPLMKELAEAHRIIGLEASWVWYYWGE